MEIIEQLIAGIESELEICADIGLLDLILKLLQESRKAGL